MPRLSEPVRLAVLADLHESLDEADLQKLAALVEEAAPDLILLDGDMLNGDSADAADVCTLTERLSQIAPVYCALGNHEIAYLEAGTSPLLEKLEQAGAAVLEQSFVDLKLGGGIRLGGPYEYAFAQNDFNTCDPDRMDPAVYGFLQDFQATDRCKILLCHRPDSFVFGEVARTWDVDLVISGHLHGGQVVLPLLGGVYGGDQDWFPRYVHGVYEKEGETTVTATVTENGCTVATYTIPVQVYDSKIQTGGSKKSIDIYIDSITDTTAYYSLNCTNQLVKTLQGERFYLEYPVDTHMAIDFFGAPNDGYVLTCMSATNSDGKYEALNGETAKETNFYTAYQTAGWYQRLYFGHSVVENMVETAMGLDCDGGLGFTRRGPYEDNCTGDGSATTSNLTFRSQKLPTVTKEVVSVGGQTYTPDMIAKEGNVIVFRVMVTEYAGEDNITYTNEMLTNKLNGAKFMQNNSSQINVNLSDFGS